MTSASDPGGPDRSTFRRYVRRLEAWRRVERGEITGEEVTEAVESLDAAVAAVEGRGFEVTPFAPCPELASAVGLDPSVELWVKDETGNVSGTHKARHLFGTALAHRLDGKTAGGSEVSGTKGDLGGSPEASPAEADRDNGGGTEVSGAERDRGSGSPEAPYAIASCGNAALAAAVLARAVGRALDVYVPVWANPAVTDRITELGGRVVRCSRTECVLGDPAHHAMKAAVAAGAVAFSCQGTDTPTAIDGARTLAYEMADALADADRPGPARLDRVFVQVGGGALATALVTGLAAPEGLDRLPVIHAVQPEGNHPLVRAWDRVTAEITGQPAAADNQARAAVAAELGPLGDETVRAVGARLAADPQKYMTPWETEPVSYATGILDDIAYDWTAVVEAMLRSGGHPVVASEDDLRQAHRLARLHTGIDVCPTGASGLGGLLALLATAGSSGAVRPGERVAVLFTGRLRPGDPDPLTPSDLGGPLGALESGRGVAVLQPAAHALRRVLADGEQSVLGAGGEARSVQTERHQGVEGRLDAVWAELRTLH